MNVFRFTVAWIPALIKRKCWMWRENANPNAHLESKQCELKKCFIGLGRLPLNFCKVNLEGLPRSCLTRKIPSLLHGMFCCFVSLFSSYKSFCEHLDLRFLLMFSVCVWLMLGPTLLENEIKVFSFCFFLFFFW